jgi:hypothetical protein
MVDLKARIATLFAELRIGKRVLAALVWDLLQKAVAAEVSSAAGPKAMRASAMLFCAAILPADYPK